jgi:hypothetical protein
LENTQGSLQSQMPGSTVKHGADSMMVWAAISWYGILLVPLYPFIAELLQGNTWTGWEIRYILWSRCYIQKMMQFSKTTVPPFTQLELFGYGLKSMKGNFNIFPGQHNHQI